jgi:hypothetical protein
MRLKKRYAAAAVLAAALGGWVAMEPSNTREWTPDNARAAYAEFRGDSVYVHNVRNAEYTTQHDYTVRGRTAPTTCARWSAWFLVEPFSKDWRGPAHTLVSVPVHGTGASWPSRPRSARRRGRASTR